MSGIFILIFSVLHSNLIYAGNCDNYCVGIRGNGEAVPAHWAALSRMVEDYGMPKGAAGGSSATVTMFFLDSMAGNAKVKAETDAVKKRKLQALMLKTMPEFLAVMAKQSKIADGFEMLKAYKGGDPSLKRKAIEAFQNAGSLTPQQLQEAMSKYGTLLNPELVNLVKKNPARFGPEAVKSIQNLGAFNAVTDDTLFFRPGLVDFKGMAVVLGQMADFYAGNTEPETKAAFNSYLDQCSNQAFHKEWQTVSEKCRQKFQQIAGDYLQAGKFKNQSLFNKVGTNINALPATSLLTVQGVVDYNKEKAKYENGTAEKIEDFSVNFKRDMAFGYWGKDELLNRTDRGLEAFRAKGDVRADHFFKLGPGNWFEVLATSPAEPGIANAQPIPQYTTREQVLNELSKPIEERWKDLNYRSDVISMGGFGDLQPTPVLKAQGCERTVFLTRQAAYGDSKFGQQILIRLTGTKKEIPFWQNIGDAAPPGWCPEKITAAGGDPATVNGTPWSQTSNLCNPTSSFHNSLDAADAVFCTNWDDEKFDVFKGNMRALVKDSYQSPMIPLSDAGKGCKLNKQPVNKDPRVLHGCIPYPKPGENKSDKDAAGQR